MGVVNIGLYVNSVTAYLGCHCHRDFLGVNKPCDFGYEGCELYSGADIGLTLAYLRGECGIVVASAVDCSL